MRAWSSYKDLRRRFTPAPARKRADVNAIIHAIGLGIIQGITELFPISSAAHTVLLSYLFRWDFPSLPFVVMLHLGTFLAVLVYFWQDYAALVRGLVTGIRTQIGRASC